MGEDAGELGRQIERLYALPPAAFTAARQELAVRLRREGRRQDAAAVKALRRPTPAAWAVSRLLRLEPQRFKELLAAGRQARQAQRRVLAGKGAPSEAAAEELRQSLSTAKRLVEELRRRGLELLGGAARPPTAAIADRLTADLQALAYTADAEQALAPGWLDHDLEAPGFEVLAGLQAAAGARPAASRRVPERRAAPEAQRAERAVPAQLPAASVAAAAASDASQRRRERQRARVAAAAAAVQRATDEAAKGRAAAATAERDAAAAERDATAARRRAEQARTEAQRERRRAEQADERLRLARERHAAARAEPG